MIHVKLYGQSLGFVEVKNQRVHFQYAESWLSHGFELSPLITPRSRTIYSDRLSSEGFRGLPSFIADALPDRFGNKIIDAYYAKLGLSPKDVSIEDRLSYLGNKAMGALEFEPVVDLLQKESSALELSKLVMDARNAINDHLDAVTQDLIAIGTSAGGARPKAIIGANHDFSQILHGHADLPQGFEHYLIKFDGVDENNRQCDPKGYTNIEYVYALMARNAGIEMMDCRLVHSGGLDHFVTKRFDRHHHQKIHSITLCGLTQLDFNSFQVASYADYFNTLNLLNLDQKSKEEAFRRMVFNVLGVNRDDHTKNFAFLVDRHGQWSLAPAYDLTHACNEVNPNAWTREHNLLINGKGLRILFNDLLEESGCLELSQSRRWEITQQVIVALEGWGRLSQSHEVSAHKRSQIQRHIQQAIADLDSSQPSQSVSLISRGAL